MFIRFCYVLIAVLAGISNGVQADDDLEAMFGLRWGMSPTEITAMGVSLEKKNGQRNMETYSSVSLPKNLADSETYILKFGDGKLGKIVLLTKTIRNDPLGSEGKKRYESLKNNLIEKYGAPDVFERVGLKLYKEKDEFYQCLAYPLCGAWNSSFVTKSKSIVLELQGSRSGDGYIELTVEDSGEWPKMINKYNSMKNKAEKDAL